MGVPCRVTRRARAGHSRKHNSPRCFPQLCYLVILSLIICEVRTTQERFQSHDNILRIQLWDSDALSRSARLSDDEPSGTTDKIVESSEVIDDRIGVKPVHVKVDDLMGEMLNTYYESHLNVRDIKNRFRRHRKHNNNRRRMTRDNVNLYEQHLFPITEKFPSDINNLRSQSEKAGAIRSTLESRGYHDEKRLSKILFDDDNTEQKNTNDPSKLLTIEDTEKEWKTNLDFVSTIPNTKAVLEVENIDESDSTNKGVDFEKSKSSYYKVIFSKKDFTRKVRRQVDNAETTDKTTSSEAQDTQLTKQVAVVRKCCPSGQNITTYLINGTRGCAPTFLTFQPLFYEMYDRTHMTLHASNLFETIVGYPACHNKKFKLDPEMYSDDQFFLFTNGSIFVPFRIPKLLGPNDFCMDTFWNSTNPAGVTLPVACFEDDTQTAGPYASLIMYAIGLLISVPFLVATSLAYILTPELREAHGLALASHCGCLAVAFACLAAAQLSGHEFPDHVCTWIAYVIQFCFVSCFFWLNVMCYNNWINVRHLSSATSRSNERRRFVFYSAYAWLLPLALLLISLFLKMSPAVPNTYAKPDSGAVGCQFESDKGALLYFYAPVGCILVANVVIFILTSRAFAKQLPRLERLSIAELTHPELVAADADDSLRLSDPTSASDTTSSPSDESPVTNKFNNFKHRWKKYKKIFRMCCLLSILLGLSCVIELVSWLAGSGGSGSWSVFDVLNALQGVVVFSIFVAMKPYREIIWRRLRQKHSYLRHQPVALAETMSERRIIRTDLKRERVYV